ncbi:MAG: zinc protease [Paracoccaceae bacterium]|jgi:zinc protease
MKISRIIPSLVIAAFAVGVLASAKTLHAMDIRKVVSDKGIVAWFVPDKSVPLLAMSFAFRNAGSATDPDGKEGLAEMTSGLLDEGAGEMKSQAFQRALEDIAAQMSFSAGQDTFTGQLRTLTAEREKAFELLRLALNAPRFDDDPVKRIQSQILASLRQQAKNPRQISGRLWSETVFPNHPYSKPSNGTEKTVATLTADDLRSFTRDRFSRDRLIIGVVGDISEEELKQRLDSVFGDLPAKGRKFEIPETTAAGSGKTLIIRKQIPQSMMILGHAGIKRDDADWYAALLVTRIFGGGGLSSRLYEEIREKRGLAYSVYAYLSPMRHSALLAGGVATQNARAAESLSVIRAEWQKLAESGVTAKELETAKTYMNGSFPLRLGSSRGIAGMLVGIQISDLGMDYIKKRPSLINSISLNDANRVAKRLYKADALTVVIVGDPKGIDEKR